MTNASLSQRSVPCMLITCVAIRLRHATTLPSSCRINYYFVSPKRSNIYCLPKQAVDITRRLVRFRHVMTPTMKTKGAAMAAGRPTLKMVFEL